MEVQEEVEEVEEVEVVRVGGGGGGGPRPNEGAVGGGVGDAEVPLGVAGAGEVRSSRLRTA